MKKEKKKIKAFLYCHLSSWMGSLFYATKHYQNNEPGRNQKTTKSETNFSYFIYKIGIKRSVRSKSNIVEVMKRSK